MRADRLILHSGLSSDVHKFGITDDWIRLTADFWREEIARYAAIGVTVVLENIVDDTPSFLQEVHDRVDHPNLKLCLDTGHVNVWSEKSLDYWLDRLGKRILHIHLHNNNGREDQHRAPEDGTLDLSGFIGRVKAELPDAVISLEVIGDLGSSIGILDRIICS